MTRDQNIAYIRAACIRANPGIASDLRGVSQEDLSKEYDNFLSICRDFASQTEPGQRTFMGVTMAFDRLQKLSDAAAVFQDRPVRLADVLLAMQEKAKTMTPGVAMDFPIGVDFNGYLNDCDKDCNDVHPLEFKWDLLHDDLELQDDKFLEFLAGKLI